MDRIELFRDRRCRVARRRIFDRHHHHRFPIFGYQGGLRVLVTLLDKIFDTMDLNTNVAGETDYSFETEEDAAS